METIYKNRNTEFFKVVLLMLILLPLPAFNQNFNLIGDKSFGTIGGEQSPLILKFNSNIIVAGYTSYTGVNGDKTESSCSGVDAWIIFLSDSLNIVWDKTIGGLGQDRLYGLTNGFDNSIVFSGETFSDSSCEISTATRGITDYWLYMLDSNMNKLMDTRFGSNNSESGGKLINCINGDFLVFGGSGGGISGDKATPGYGSSDFWLIRTDSLGNKLWDQTYGGAGQESANFSARYCIGELSTSEIILGGRTSSSMSGSITASGYVPWDAWIAKVNSSGTQIWDKMFGGMEEDGICKVLDLQDSYLLLGTSDSKSGGTISDTGIVGGDVWLVKIDSLGNQIWDRRYGGIGSDNGLDIQKAPDGGYWVLASTNSPVGYDVSEVSYGDEDYWIFKIDTAGNKIWDKRFGGPGNDFASNFIIMPDSSIFICGYAESGTSAVKTDSGHGDYDYWVVHFNYYNNTTGIQNFNSANGVSLSHNPAKSIVTIKGLPNIRLETSLIGMDGRLINHHRIQGGAEMNYTLEDVSPGMYLLRFTGEQFTATVKVLKE